MRLNGKIAIVTGAGSAISRETAIQFARQGAKLALVDTEEQGAIETARQVAADGGQAIVIVADVSLAEQVELVLDRTVAELGLPTILFNNLDVHNEGVALLTEVDEETFDRCITGNVMGVWLTIKAISPKMAEAGGGSIINVSTVAALVSTDTIAYSGAKAAVLGMTRNLAIELGPDNVRLNTLCLGEIRSASPVELPIDELKTGHLSALGRTGEAAEVAQAALFLASDESSYTTASTLMVDAGWSVMRPAMTVSQPKASI